MGDAARTIWGSKGKERLKSKRVLGIVDKQPAGGAGHRAYPAVFRDRAGGQVRAACRENRAGMAGQRRPSGWPAEAGRSSRRHALPLSVPAGRGLSHLV